MSKLKLLNDQPILEGSAQDGLGFETYAKVLSEAAVQTQGPFNIGVFGEWGSGKTSLLRLIESNLNNHEKECVVTVWFNAWKFEAEEEPLIPLIARIVKELEDHKSLKDKAVHAIKNFRLAIRALIYGLKLKGKFRIPEAFEAEIAFSAKDATDKKDELSVDPILDPTFYQLAYDCLEAAIKILPNEFRIVVFIDDLDRCLPDKGVKLLESIKLVLDQSKMTFFLGLARSVVEGYLNHRYEEDFGIDVKHGHSYLDKIIQLSFDIPPHHSRMMDLWNTITNNLTPEQKSDLRGLDSIIDIAASSNPRSAVRFLNNLLIDRGIHAAIDGGDPSENKLPIYFFAISRITQRRWPTFYRYIVRAEDEKVEEIIKFVVLSINENETNALHEKDAKLEPLRALVHDRDLRKLLSGPFGKEWLEDHKKRKATIDFLQSERPEREAPISFDQQIGIFRSPSLEERYDTELKVVLQESFPEFTEIWGPYDIDKIQLMIAISPPSDAIIGPIKDAIQKGKRTALALCGTGEISSDLKDFCQASKVSIVRIPEPSDMGKTFQDILNYATKSDW